MPRKLDVLIIASSVDKNDVGGSRMAYDWINRLSTSVNICVITTGSRFRSTTGLENCANVEQIILKSHIHFKWCGAFDRIVQPGYVEFFFKAYKVIKKCARKKRYDVCHQIMPRSPRYPSPLIGIDTPLVIGPFHGGL